MLKEKLVFKFYTSGKSDLFSNLHFAENNVASFLDLRFHFVTMHSWLHEHKQM